MVSKNTVELYILIPLVFNMAETYPSKPCCLAILVDLYQFITAIQLMSVYTSLFIYHLSLSLSLTLSIPHTLVFMSLFHTLSLSLNPYITVDLIYTLNPSLSLISSQFVYLTIHFIASQPMYLNVYLTHIIDLGLI